MTAPNQSTSNEVTESRHTDVVIVGAGPAGTAAAITLANAGTHVIVIDKATFPRDKFCGDGLTSGCLRMLEALGLDPNSVPSWQPVSDVFLSPPNTDPITFPLPRDRGQYAAVATRFDLDNALVELARSKGVEIRDGHACTDVQLRPDAIAVSVEGLGQVNANYLIAADGMWSPVRKMVGLREPSYRGEWHAFRQYFSNVGERAATELHVWFEPDVLPGYVWSFPLPGGRANIGFGVLRAKHDVGSMGKYWPAILDRPHIRAVIGDDAVPEGKHRAWPIPARLGQLELTAPRTFFVGDAAAACDPMTGEGIGQAIETGIAAARAILDAGPDRPDQARTGYCDEIGRNLEVDMAFAGQLGNLLANPTIAGYALRFAGLTPWTRRNFARWLFEDYPRAVLGTPHRWSRDVFTQPGSYLTTAAPPATETTDLG